MKDRILKKCDNYAKILNDMQSVKFYNFTDKIIESRNKKLKEIEKELLFSYKDTLFSIQNKFIPELSRLDSNNPAKILKNALYRIEKNEKKVVSVKEVSVGDKIAVFFSDGKITAAITEKEEGGIPF